MFQSKTLLGDSMPFSTYVLWPYEPRKQTDGYPVVAYAHGATGILVNGAPSHMKTIWQHFEVPYQLALQGYVVVGPDYTGLGVGKTALGEDIPHEFMSGPSQANDTL